MQSNSFFDYIVRMVESMLFRSNKGYSITIDTEKGELNEFSVCGKPLIQSVSMPLFSLRLRDEDGKNVDVNTYSATICETLEDTNERCVFKYSGFADVSIANTVAIKLTLFQWFLCYRQSGLSVGG